MQMTSSWQEKKKTATRIPEEGIHPPALAVVSSWKPSLPSVQEDATEKQHTPATETESEEVLWPLHTTWWVWIYPRRKDWIRDGKKGFQKFPFAVSTVQDFIGFFDRFPSLQEGQYFFFRDGIFPEWESPANIRGGRWSLSVPDKVKLREMWLLVCEGCIAENLFIDGQDNQNVNGVEVCYKRGYVKLWIRNCPVPSASGSTTLHFTANYKPSFCNAKFQPNESSYLHATK